MPYDAITPLFMVASACGSPVCGAQGTPVAAAPGSQCAAVLTPCSHGGIEPFQRGLDAAHGDVDPAAVAGAGDQRGLELDTRRGRCTRTEEPPAHRADGD